MDLWWLHGHHAGWDELNHTATTLFTIGHSTRSAAELVALLAEHDITRLVDVRTVPRSRHNPQFNRDDFADTLADAGITYRHVSALGGLRKPNPDSVNDGWKNESFRAYADHLQTEEFAVAMEALVADVQAAPTAVMCAEAVPWRCHRWLISDAALVRGLNATHIMGAGKTREHVMTRFAEVSGQKLTYPFTLSSG